MNNKISRRTVVAGLSVSALAASQGKAGTSSLQEFSAQATRLPEVRIYRAKSVLTMAHMENPADAVAVIGDRILAAGTYEKVVELVGAQQHVVDDSFAGKTLIAGLIDQHLHPVLAALTMTFEIIAIEDWDLPTGLSKAAESPEDYMARLVAAEAAMEDAETPLLTWGYHHYFHGIVRRPELDAISETRPIIIWHRSAHEFILNSAALSANGIDAKMIASFDEAAQAQTDLDAGHFYEAGGFAVLPTLAPVIAQPERLIEGLELTRDYLHRNGVTMTCEPGGIVSKSLQDAQNKILGGPDVPFRTYYLPDGKTFAQNTDQNKLVEATKSVLDWGKGQTEYLPDRVKLFADGAIYSQLMQLTEPYTDGHEGEWIMDPGLFNQSFQTFWDAGYQIHIHQNGDKGLDLVLDALEMAMRRNPRHDHRTLIAHFGYARAEQVAKIKALGAIVSANPYYVTALADRYGEAGLGPERADQMVRLGDVDRAGISISFHSDMPMAPAQPLFLAWAAVNRLTTSGRVAGPEQRISVDRALRAITIDAAYSLGLENEVGSIEAGKMANFTILEENPYDVAPERLKDIGIWGTVHEGRIFPVKKIRRRAALSFPVRAIDTAGLSSAMDRAGARAKASCGCCHDTGPADAPSIAARGTTRTGRGNVGCCSTNRLGWMVAEIWAKQLRNT